VGSYRGWSSSFMPPKALLHSSRPSFFFRAGDRSRSRKRADSSWPTSRRNDRVEYLSAGSALVYPWAHCDRDIASLAQNILLFGVKATQPRNITVVTLTRAYFPFPVARYRDDRVRNSMALYPLKSHRPLCASNFLQHPSSSHERISKERSARSCRLCGEFFYVKSQRITL